MRTIQRAFTSIIAILLTLAFASNAIAAGRTYSAQLSGGEEVPANASTATGMATYTLSDDGMTLSYKITLNNITNPFMGHIHVGAKGANGPVVLPLYSATPGGGPKTTLVVEGTATAAQLSGPLAGKTMADLVAEMNAGNTYTNFHTNDGKDPANSGPGDLAAGEIRGQIMAASAPGLPNTGAGGATQGLPPTILALALALSLASLLALEGRRRALRAR
jgi:hypothetical protein